MGSAYPQVHLAHGLRRVGLHHLTTSAWAGCILSGMKVVTWNVAKAPRVCALEIIPCFVPMCGPHIIIGLQEVASWPSDSKENANVEFWEYRHVAGAAVAFLLPSSMGSMQSGSFARTGYVGGIMLGYAAIINTYLPESGKDKDDYRGAIEDVEACTKRGMLSTTHHRHPPPHLL